jgi:hypothetical protein
MSSNSVASTLTKEHKVGSHERDIVVSANIGQELHGLGYMLREAAQTSQAGPAITRTTVSARASDHLPRFIFLITAQHNKLQVDAIKSNGISDREFALQLRSWYFKSKGWFRAYFSIYTFSHCEFVEVRTLYDNMSKY